MLGEERQLRVSVCTSGYGAGAGEGAGAAEARPAASTKIGVMMENFIVVVGG